MHDAYNCFIPLNPNGAVLIPTPTNAALICNTTLADPVAATHGAACAIVQLMFPTLASNATDLLLAELALLPSANTTEQQAGVDIGFDIGNVCFGPFELFLFF